MIENRAKLIHITPEMYDNKVNNIAEWNLLHDIINTPKRAKNINSNYSPILHGCVNNRNGRARLKKFQIILDSGWSSTILMIGLVHKLSPEKYSVMQWQTQAGNITNNLKVNVDFIVTALSATNVVTWKCHMDNSAKGRHEMTLVRYLWTYLGLKIIFSDHVIEADDGP